MAKVHKNVLILNYVMISNKTMLKKYHFCHWSSFRIFKTTQHYIYIFLNNHFKTQS